MCPESQLQPCGHLPQAISSTDEGTSYCVECESEAFQKSIEPELAPCPCGDPASGPCDLCVCYRRDQESQEWCNGTVTTPPMSPNTLLDKHINWKSHADEGTNT